MPSCCGGLGEVKQADPEIQSICDEMKPHAMAKQNTTFEKFVAHSYATQVVAGTNYFIKVDVGGDKHLHLRVHKTLPHAGSKLSLAGVVEKEASDPIEHF